MRTQHTGSNSPLLSVNDYMKALLSEYQLLHNEIMHRISMRHGIMVAVGITAIAVISKIFLFDRPFEVNEPAVLITLLAILPIFWFTMIILQIVLMAQVDRTGKVLCITELKMQLLVELAGDDCLKATVEVMESNLQKELSRKRDPNIKGWSSPILWERLLRSRKHKARQYSRWWDSLWFRNVPPLLIAAALSSLGPALLIIESKSQWWWWTILVYFATAIATAIILSQPIALGRWDFISLSLDAPDSTNEAHNEQPSEK